MILSKDFIADLYRLGTPPKNILKCLGVQQNREDTKFQLIGTGISDAAYYKAVNLQERRKCKRKKGFHKRKACIKKIYDNPTKISISKNTSKPHLTRIPEIKNVKTKSYSHPLLGTPEYKEFYSSTAWRQLRYLALKNANGACQCCGAKSSDGIQVHVDHIKPRSRYPELELSLKNLQILCVDCNLGKGDWDNTNWNNNKGKPIPLSTFKTKHNNQQSNISHFDNYKGIPEKPPR